MNELRCMVVTPEQTELDKTAASVTVPLFDGEMGILANHSPLVGRLGYGVLRIGSEGAGDEYFIEGGFVQVADNIVSVLTDKVSPRADITRAMAEEAMAQALQMPREQPEQAAAREKAVFRAQAMSRVTG